ncbi:MAG: hypothetical protein ABSG53_28770 [Thermoguttaceae bacterium]
MQHSSRLAGSSLNQELEEKKRRASSGRRYILIGSLVAYLAMATALSISQIGYFNADFVGYSTIAHRLLKAPRTAITGYWSPLYSWCMAPLIYLGVDDLTAGRMILVVGGAVYLLAVFGVVCRSHGADERRNRMITAAVMTVAVLQAATWATRMLDPDLLADALLFCYFYVVLDPMLPQRPFRALLGGAAAGTAYLAKAYMLPFTLVHLPATLLMRWWISRRSGQAVAFPLRRWGIAWVALLVGQAVIAGPWAMVLTSHYGKLTLSTAGAANHANMGPTAFGNDPLWNPGLVADYIADPHFGPDWSPLQDTEHFLHQLKVVAYNLNDCIGYVVPWVVFGGIFAAVRRGSRRRQTEKVVLSEGFPGLWWCAMTVVLYCGGYCTINLESRYIVPVIAPLLCLGAMLIVSSTTCATQVGLDGTGPRWRQSAWWVIPVVLVVSLPDVNRLVNIPLSHPQSGRLAPYRLIAEQLRSAHILPKRFAANRWHTGLGLSYAAGEVSDYLGAPLPNAATSMMEQLQNSNSAVYLRWRRQGDEAAPPSLTDAFVPAAPWTLVSIIKNTESKPTVIEVYALSARREDHP